MPRILARSGLAGNSLLRSPTSRCGCSRGVAVSDYYDLGSFGRPVSTTSPEAQRWFDRGLVWCYAFNHEEALRCFRRAVEADPGCGMAHWGVAYAIGPNYNRDWVAFEDDELADAVGTAHAALRTARALAADATPV